MMLDDVELDNGRLRICNWNAVEIRTFPSFVEKYKDKFGWRICQWRVGFFLHINKKLLFNVCVSQSTYFLASLLVVIL